MLRKKNKNTIKTSPVNRALKWIAGTLTIVWIVALMVPIYMMLVSSLTAVDTQYSDKVTLTVNAPECYTTMLEYTKEQAETLGDEGIYLEANSVLWRTFNYKMANTGKAQAIVLIDGDPTVSYTLSKANFESNQEHLWSKSRLDYRDIKRVISVIEESNWVKEKREDIELPKTKNQNEYSKDMLKEFSEDENFVANITECTHAKSYENIFDNYIVAWNYTSRMGLEGGMSKPMLNTVYIAVMEIVLNVTFCAAMAYALSKLLPRFLKHKMLLLVMASGMIPGTVTLIPRFQLLNTMGLMDSFWGLILPNVTSFGAVLLFKGCFDNYPNEILEAADMDGAGELYKFFKFVLPAAKGVIGVQIFTVFASAWNEYFMPSLIIRDENKYTVALVLNYLLNVRSAPYNITLALGFLISIPTLLIYAFFQKYLTNGIDYSGIKG